MLKRRQDGPPKFPIFFKNRPKILAITAFGPRCLLEAIKSLPRAVQGPSGGSQKPSRSPHAASKMVSEGRVASCPCHCIWNYSPELECLCQCNLSHSSPMTSVQASPVGSEKLSGGVPSTSSSSAAFNQDFLQPPSTRRSLQNIL